MTDHSGVVVLQKRKQSRVNQRKKTIFYLVFTLSILATILIIGNKYSELAVKTSFRLKETSPGFEHIFGTDWLGRDMLARTLKGLSLSIWIGILASVVSTIIAIILGSMSALMGKKVDAIVGVMVDVVMGIPHMLLLILVSYALGKGTFGVTVAVAVSHWPSLTRVIRGEILQIKEANYIKIAEQLGQSKTKIAIRHMIPHVLPQILVGFVLLFPHAILHEASITFLGFGMPPDQPAIGRILSESMKYLVLGEWWLAVFPGIALLLVVFLFDTLGHSLCRLIDPHSAHN